MSVEIQRLSFELLLPLLLKMVIKSYISYTFFKKSRPSVRPSVKVVFCKQPFQTCHWKIWLSYPNSQNCRNRMRDLSFTKSFFLLFTSYFDFLFNPVFILLYSEIRRCCCLMFHIISLELITGYPATSTGTPPFLKIG